MMNADRLGDGLAFGLVSVLYAAVAGWLIFQVMQKEMESRQAGLVYLPLLLCWIGFAASLGPAPVLAGLLVLLSLAWCIWVPYRVIVVNENMKADLMQEKIDGTVRWLAQHPEDGIAHFRLAETYEDYGMLREAYGEYCAVVKLDGENKHARIRAQELYQDIVKREARSASTLADLAPPPEDRRAPKGEAGKSSEVGTRGVSELAPAAEGLPEAGALPSQEAAPAAERPAPINFAEWARPDEPAGPA